MAVAVVALAAWGLPGAGTATSTEADDGAEIVRVAGPDRVATALEAARVAFPEPADAAVLATAADFPDALAAGPLAASLDGPLLLMPERLSDELASALDGLGAGEVHLVGGVGAITYLAETDLTAAGLDVSRTAGETRWDTAALIAREVAGAEADEVVIAAGADFPDAVSAAALASAHRIPVLLTRPDRLPADATAAIEALGPSRATVVGGPGAVSDAVAGALPDATRLAGAERTETSVAVAREVLARGGSLDDVVIASARSFPDALTAASLAASLNAPVLLVEPDADRVGAAVDLLATDGGDVQRVLVVGGPAAVPDAVVAVLDDALQGAAGGGEDGDAEADEASAAGAEDGDEGGEPDVETNGAGSSDAGTATPHAEASDGGGDGDDGDSGADDG